MSSDDEPSSLSRSEGSLPARRRARRLPTGDLLVAVDAPEVAAKPWVVAAIDVNSLGMGLVLPPELREGTRVLLSFKLDDECEFSRLPATVVHYGPTGGGGGVRFDAWPSADRLGLLEVLVRHYEGSETTGE